MLTFALTDLGHVLGIEDALALRRAGSRLPVVVCPACRKHLIAKMGEKVAHHFAHQPNAEPCFGSTAEGELHISAKLRLLKSLQEMAAREQSLSVTQRCEDCDDPAMTRVLQLQPGDCAEVEVWLDPTRTLKPDLTVWRDDKRLALLEVLATHPCGPEKLAALERYGVPMLEVEAESIVGEGGAPPWVAPEPLPFRTTVGIQVHKHCDACREEAELAEQRRLAPREDVQAQCWVHMYLKNGTRRDLRFSLVRHWNRGEVTHAELVEMKGEQILERWAGDVAKNPEALLDAARVTARAHCRKSPENPWVELDTHGGFQLGGDWEEPFQNYWWSVKQRRWVKVKFQKGLHRWLHVSPEAIARQIQTGRFREIEVKVFANATKVVTALEAKGVESFEKWLRSKYGGELPPMRWYIEWDE